MIKNSSRNLAATVIAVCALATAGIATANPASARYMCKEFIPKRGYVVQEWGETWNWTTIDNKDGTWSVGARIVGMPPGGGVKNMYLSCVLRQSGDTWRLESLTRLQ